MKIRVTSEVEISDEEISRLFARKLDEMCTGASMWVRNGKVWQDDPEWRHGSITESQVKWPSKAAEADMVKYLEWLEKRRAAAAALRALLRDEPKGGSR